MQIVQGKPKCEPVAGRALPGLLLKWQALQTHKTMAADECFVIFPLLKLQGCHLQVLSPFFTLPALPKALPNIPDNWLLMIAGHGMNPPLLAAYPKMASGCFFCLNGQGAPGTWIAINVDDVDACYDIIKEKGAKIISPPDKEWFMREMPVEDIDGHIIRFGHGIE